MQVTKIEERIKNKNTSLMVTLKVKALLEETLKKEILDL